MTTPGLEFWDESGAFGARISPDALSKVLESCRRSAPEETGGILVGYYTDALDCAVVTGASERPPDSRSGRTWFVRGTAGLQGLVDGLWRGKERRYYLGEWHFHPDGSPKPSPTDERQMAKIAGSASYKCPEPVLVLAGGSASSACDVRVYVFTKARASAPIELRARDEAEEAP
ncbi:MAG: Mov34/MPN/PAD-1 family protein [Actinomycetota bacterium]|nr:Mov34/MPN/PAD-1 family protein [Actinomycetota bacterium]